MGLIYEDKQRALFLMFSADADAVDCSCWLPPHIAGRRWHPAVDTFGAAPRGLFADGERPLSKDSHTYPLNFRSGAILLVRGAKWQKLQPELTKAE
jgi:hypothetical protein